MVDVWEILDGIIAPFCPFIITGIIMTIVFGLIVASLLIIKHIKKRKK